MALYQQPRSDPKPLNGFAINLAFAAVAVIVITVVTGVGSGQSGFDCTDGSWAESVSMAERDAIYRTRGGIVRSILAGIGVVGIGWLAVSQWLWPFSTPIRLLVSLPIIGGLLWCGAMFWFSFWLYNCTV